MHTEARWVSVCASRDLAEKTYVITDIRYAGEPHSAILLRFDGEIYAYLNQCVHMPRALDCERDTIFDRERLLLRCSMHGIVYAPQTGESVSTLCQGERLQALRSREVDGIIYLTDKRVTSLMKQPLTKPDSP